MSADEPRGGFALAYCTLDRSPLFGQPETLREQLSLAARAGFTHASIDMFALRAHVAAGHDLRALADHCAACGISAWDIAGTNVSADPDASRAEARELAGYAQALGAPWLQARLTAPVDAAALATYRDCAAIAADAGVGLGLEFSPFTPIRTLAGAREVLAEVRAGTPRAGIIVDVWHLHFGDGLDALRATPAGDIAFVQFDDVAAGTTATMHDTMNDRALPGAGVAGTDGFLAALAGVGWSGVLSVEVLSADLRGLPLAAYVQRCHDITRAALRP